jgi:hypothetical protein
MSEGYKPTLKDHKAAEEAMTEEQKNETVQRLMGLRQEKTHEYLYGERGLHELEQEIERLKSPEGKIDGKLCWTMLRHEGIYEKTFDTEPSSQISNHFFGNIEEIIQALIIDELPKLKITNEQESEFEWVPTFLGTFGISEVSVKIIPINSEPEIFIETSNLRLANEVAKLMRGNDQIHLSNPEYKSKLLEVFDDCYYISARSPEALNLYTQALEFCNKKFLESAQKYNKHNDPNETIFKQYGDEENNKNKLTSFD